MNFPVRLPSVKFPSIGDAVTGTVLNIDEEAEVPHFSAKGVPEGIEMDPDTGKPLTQIDVTLQKIDGGKAVLHTRGAISYAVGLALAEIGAEDLEIGDTLTVTYTGDGAKKPGRTAPKQYSAAVVKELI